MGDTWTLDTMGRLNKNEPEVALGYGTRNGSTGIKTNVGSHSRLLR
jgi:hypothetical protein